MPAITSFDYIGASYISMRRILMFILPYGHMRHAMYHPTHPKRRMFLMNTHFPFNQQMRLNGKLLCSLKSFWVIGDLSPKLSVTVKMIKSFEAIIQHFIYCDIMVILAIFSRVIKCPSAFKMSFHKFGYDYFRLRRQWMHSQNKNACFTSCLLKRIDENHFLNASISCLGTRYCLIIFFD